MHQEDEYQLHHGSERRRSETACTALPSSQDAVLACLSGTEQKLKLSALQ